MKNSIIPFFLSLLFIVGMQAQNEVSKELTSKPSKGYEVGDVATDFNLRDVGGDLVSLNSIENAKGYIVVFTSNVCPFAIMYQDRLINLHNKMAAKGYPVVAINPNDPNIEEGDSFESMKLLAKEQNLPYFYVKDDKQEVFPKYGATKTPHVFLLDKTLKVQYIGAIDDNAKSEEEVEVKYVENAIAALEAGELPSPNFTKAIGCGIKSSKANGGKRGNRGARGDRKGPPSPDQILEMMDKDGDKKVSKTEVQGPLTKEFDSLDTDKDGFLNIDELKSIKPKKRRSR